MSENEMDFKSFRKIPALHSSSLRIRITQKIHGTNGQLLIWKDKEGEMHLKAGSRNRWLTPEDDNYGFAKWAHTHKYFLIEFLGCGRHYGEWAGKGVNKGEGLSEKRFFLFNRDLMEKNFFDKHELYKKCRDVGVAQVPILYDVNVQASDRGKDQYDFWTVHMAIEAALCRLKINGSRIKWTDRDCPPEGIVIEIYDEKRINPPIFFKKTFSQEESPWEGKKEKIIPTNLPDVSHLLQPLRLEKLLSRDERYLRDYPNSLKDIAAAYVKDLDEENEMIRDGEPLSSESKELIKNMKKALGRRLFKFIKSEVEKQKWI